MISTFNILINRTLGLKIKVRHLIFNHLIMLYKNIYFQGKCIDDEKPANRRVLRVFQGNALWLTCAFIKKTITAT
jgi:hypothetical protein